MTPVGPKFPKSGLTLACKHKLLLLVQAVRVEIERVCALLEEITIFCPDDQ